MKRLVWIGNTLAVGLLILGACAPAAAPEIIIQTQIVKETEIVKEQSVVEVTAVPGEVGVVTFAGFYPIDAPKGRWINSLGYRLEAEHPECDFQYVEAPGIKGTEALLLRIQEGDPTVIGCNSASGSPTGGELFKAGLVYDLSADMDTPPYGATEGKWFDTFSVSAQTQMSDYPGGVKLEVPYEPTNWVLWYNTDIYEKYGLKEPKTWPELMANCEAIKQGSGDDISCIGGGGYPGYVTYWYSAIIHGLINQTKGLWFGPYLEDKSKVVRLDSEVSLTAAKTLFDMVEAGYTTAGFLGGDFTLNQTVYFQGKAAHLYVGTWLIGEMSDVIPKDFKQNTTYFPAMPGGTGTYEWVTGTINAYGICKPGKKSEPSYSTDCGVQFMKLYTSPDVSKDWVTAHSTFASTKGAPGPDSIPGGTEVMANLKEWSANLDGIYSYCPEVYSLVTDELILYLDGSTSLEEFGANAQLAVEEAWGRCKVTLGG